MIVKTVPNKIATVAINCRKDKYSLKNNEAKIVLKNSVNEPNGATIDCDANIKAKKSAKLPSIMKLNPNIHKGEYTKRGIRSFDINVVCEVVDWRDPVSVNAGDPFGDRTSIEDGDFAVNGRRFCEA
jgi:hypothetical protein